jgi:ParB family chromosome partitioning protein
LNLLLEKIVPGKYQPRTILYDQTLQELADTIKEQGVIQPLIVRKKNIDQYKIIAGERRWRAAKIAGLTKVPCIMRDIPDETALAFALIENIQREDLNPIDHALAMSQLRDEFGMTHENIASKVGCARSSITNLLRLLTLPDEIKHFLKTKEIEVGHAKLLLKLEEPKQIVIAQNIISNGLSVREAEKLIQYSKQKIHKPVNNFFDPRLENLTIQWNEVLSKKLSSKVTVKLNKEGKGKIHIEVNSMKEVEWLVKNLRIK